jgi:uncharacterized lipoprotein YehR (DUF1307 family)
MKKLFYAIIAMAVAVVMVSCTKGALSGSIVGKWELTKAEATYIDKDGNAQSAKDVLTAMYKAMGISDTEIAKIIDMAVESMNDVEPVRLSFNADGTVNAEYKDEDGKWEAAPEKGTYKLEGDKLSFSAPDEKGKMQSLTTTVISLTSSELKIQTSLKEIAGEGNASKIEELGYDAIMTETFKKI